MNDCYNGSCEKCDSCIYCKESREKEHREFIRDIKELAEEPIEVWLPRLERQLSTRPILRLIKNE